MILILTEAFDPATDLVAEWLNYHKVPFLRINSDEPINQVSAKLDRSEINFNFREQNFSINDFYALWYRRGAFRLNGITPKTANNRKEFEIFVASETSSFCNYFHWMLERRPKLGSYFSRTINKLITLESAMRVGLRIPLTAISNNKAMLSDLLDPANPQVTKSIANNYTYTDRNFHIHSYTEQVSLKDIEKLGDNTSLTLLQTNIKKLFELRVFFLKDKYFAMALFTQANKMSLTDSRRSDPSGFVRTVPFKLPPVIRNKLKLLMKNLKLDTGSIDMIVTPDGEYVFLEINPIGQFGMVSYHCNYHLEKRIAEYIIAKRNEKRDKLVSDQSFAENKKG